MSLSHPDRISAMYGLPPDIDLLFLKEATLLQVCIGENEVVLGFFPQISIMVASTIRVVRPEGSMQTLEDARDAGISLSRLLGDSIQEVAGSTDGTLCLTWGSGEVVEILDTWKEFESYTIQKGDRIIVV